jgi:hypothetical protein
MKQVPDRMRLRREYLKQRNVEVLRVAVDVGFLCAIIFLLFHGNKRIVPIYGMLGVITVRLVTRGVRRAQAIKQIPYVPPVTPDALPADEILVRGSVEPPIEQSEMLLRGAQKGEETPQEELLRVSQE